MDRVPMGVSHLRGVASHTADAVQAQCVLLESIEDALESSLGYNPELSVLGGLYRLIPV